MAEPSVLIAVPTRGDPQWATVTRLQEIRDEHPGLPPVLFQPGHLSVAATRNEIARRFLDTGLNVLVMVDDDVVPPLSLLRATRRIPDFAVVAVPTWIWRPELDLLPVLAAFRENGGLKLHRPVTRGVEEVDAVGTGCVAVSRELLKALGPDPFQVEREDGRTVSDDVVFCRQVRKAGFRVAADFSHTADHHARVSLAHLATSLDRLRR